MYIIESNMKTSVWMTEIRIFKIRMGRGISSGTRTKITATHDVAA